VVRPIVERDDRMTRVRLMMMVALVVPLPILATVLLLAVGCGPAAEDPPADVSELMLGSPRVVVGEDEAMLAVPVDMAIDDEGTVYVLDRQDARIVVAAPDGATTTLGQRGQGPGEFGDPYFLGVTTDGLRVYDRTRQSVQVLGLDGTPDHAYTVEQAGLFFVTGASFSRDGTMAYAGTQLGDDRGLALLVGPEGGEPTIVGELISDAEVVARFTTEYVHQGRIPEFMHNHVLPMLAPSGELWLFLQTDSGLRRYSPEGSLLRSADFDVPESGAIRAEYFAWYEDWGDGVLRYLEYVVDGFATEDRVWLLWNTPPGDEGLITVHDDTGEILRRLRYTLPAGPPPEVDPDVPYVSRRYMAIDFARRIAYLADTDTSSLYALDVPAEILR
jgi:hypothetical protein